MDKKQAVQLLDDWTHAPHFNNNSIFKRLLIATLTKLIALLSWFFSLKRFIQVKQHGDDFLADLSLADIEVHAASHEKNCKKNPDHSDLIPIKEFTVDHLPENYQDEKIAESIRILSDLIVQIKVSSSKGKCRLGSGRIFYILERTESGRCPCRKCKASEPSKRSDKFWYIIVNTTPDLVYNEQDALHATCRLFYDDFGVPMVIVDGVGIVEPATSKAQRQLVCATCNPNIVPRLEESRKSLADLYKSYFNKYWDMNNDVKLVVYVSHPHGSPQRVSARMTLRTLEDLESEGVVLPNNSGLCPGSYGAYMLIL